ncbi:M14 family metallocarboxypeptidase [Verrucomicrobiaceae bacterium N1E253]|uniref:M14 family metallocarboxypeptidase n=1 Tax=Oceaniferula marina TaxID=2748318 RepID=A0A851GHJ7_9BACT|nr:M14 family metallocarboxypeptidase [Oceaniferula marina]NWK56352.1 M14 family metallocarboxypeptidase [Oceaniferula marina]
MTFNIEAFSERFDHSAMLAGFRRELITSVQGMAVAGFTKCVESGDEGGGRPWVYISAGVHGDEPAGPMAMLALLKEGVFDERANWLMCPFVNPLGLAAGTRENASGIDLNRDYLERSSEEVQAHAAWLESKPVPDLFVSLHEDWESSGFYLYEINVAGVTSGAHAILDAASSEIPPEPEPVIDDHEVREPGWIDHSPKADLPKHWPEAIFLAERGAGVSYTLETPSSLDLIRRIRCHQLAAGQALDGFLASVTA